MIPLSEIQFHFLVVKFATQLTQYCDLLEMRLLNPSFAQNYLANAIFGRSLKITSLKKLEKKFYKNPSIGPKVRVR